MKHLCPRSVMYFGIETPTPPAFTPKWIWSRFVQSHFPGREATNDAAASSHRRVRGTPARSGVQGMAENLPKFATFMEQRYAPYITTELALKWATQPAD